MTAFLNPWFLLVAFLALGGSWTSGYVTGDHTGANRVQVAWDSANDAAIKQRVGYIKEARKAERELQEKDYEDRQKQQAVARARDTRIAVLERELHNRPERPAEPRPGDMPSGTTGAGRPDAPAGSGCTASGLYRDDAEFLVGLSRLASIAQAERDACVAKYRAADAKLRALATH